MSDVAYTSLHDQLEVNPIYPIFQKCLHKSQEAHGASLKTDPDAKYELIYRSDFFKPEYNEYLSVTNNDYAGLDQFKKYLNRSLSCQIQSFSLINPFEGKRFCNVCRSQGCPNCGPYQANKRLKYVDSMIRYAMFDDMDNAISVMDEIRGMIAKNNWIWLTVVITPKYNGGGMLRIGNLLPQYDNPLVDDGQHVRDSIAEIDDLYGFDKVTRLSSPELTQVTYITGTGIQFTSTDLYHMKKSGKKGKGVRELGTPRGFEFNAELNEITYRTQSQIKEQKKEEQGIIGTKNTPGVTVNHVPKNTVRETLIQTGRELSLHKDRMIFHHDNIEGMAITNVKIMNLWRDNLTEAGYPQPDHYNAINITQKDYDKFDKLGVQTGIIPDNILDMEIVLPEVDRTKLSSWPRYIQARTLLETQEKIAISPTIEQWADELLDKMYNRIE